MAEDGQLERREEAVAMPRRKYSSSVLTIMGKGDQEFGSLVFPGTIFYTG